jgi:hypothetical protein
MSASTSDSGSLTGDSPPSVTGEVGGVYCTRVELIHSFSCSSHLEHMAPFGVSVITHILRHTVGLLWFSDQPVAEAPTYAGQHNI